MNRFVTLALLLAPASALAGEPYLPTWPASLQTDVAKAQRGFSGEFALYVKDLNEGVVYSYNAKTPMYLASGIKIPVMVALMKRVEAGVLSLDDEIVYKAEDLRDGAPLLSYLRPGTPVQLRVLLDAMIQQSDNAATDLLINHLGVEFVNEVLTEQKIPRFGPITTLIDVRRLVYRNLDPRTAGFTPQDIFRLRTTRPLEKRLAKMAELLDEPIGTVTVGDYHRAYAKYYRAGYNTGTVEGMGELLENIVLGKVINVERSKQMLGVLLGTETGGRRIRAGLPADAALAHKTGTQYRRTCDFGVFFMPGERPVVFAIAVKGGKSRSSRETIMARLARRAYWHLATPSERRRIKSVPADHAPMVETDEGEEADLLMTPLLKKAKKRKAARKKKARASTSQTPL